MVQTPAVKRAICFFDGQNLFKSAKEAFGVVYPNYDPALLAKGICANQGWKLVGIKFYTGIHEQKENAFWNHFWNSKFAVMGTRHIEVFHRYLRYNDEPVQLPDGTRKIIRVAREKGIDVRIALDMVRGALNNSYDVAVIFSQDQDLSEAVDEIRQISISENRWIQVACAFPESPTSGNKRGINKTKWITIDRNFYDQCLDPKDYRPKKLP